MSAVLMFFYWVVIPACIFQLARWLFFRTESRVVKGLIVAGTVGFVAWFLWVAVGRNMWLDHQVREMCAKDGGVKVYEMVELTSELLDQFGRIRIPDKAEVTPSDKYYYDSDIHYYLKGNTKMSRIHHRIVRRNDGKVLGELIRYARVGGGLPGLWHGSSFMCPAPTQGLKFESAVFIKGDKK
ncbi:hypothetical protein [Desulfogranum mediterraneum]|uniref:hypothetical protein n=1 Tax=Desulfogranum mediterraneum TaxID=160661 RepID=UPI00129479CE|nr:hypothetical protein [Desulfogranum mediterraneum]